MNTSEVALIVTVITFTLSCIVMFHLRPDYVFEVDHSTGSSVFSQEKLLLHSVTFALVVGLVSAMMLTQSKNVKDRKIAMKLGLI